MIKESFNKRVKRYFGKTSRSLESVARDLLFARGDLQVIGFENIEELNKAKDETSKAYLLICEAIDNLEKAIEKIPGEDNNK